MPLLSGVPEARQLVGGDRGAFVVFDVQAPALCANRLFNLEYSRQFPGAEAGAELAIWLASRGVQSVTADVFLEEHRPPGPVACLSIEQTQYTSAVLSTPGVVPAVCTSHESPIMNVSFYQGIPRLSDCYHHLFLWPGTRARVTGGSVFHEASWPYPDMTPPHVPQEWSGRRFLSLVSSCKRAFAWPRPLIAVRSPRESARALRDSMRMATLRLRDPWFRSELYLERLRAIRHFSRRSDFDLYGRGWTDETSLLPGWAASAVARCYRGEIPPLDKTRVLSGYRFAICFENTSFEGYITEKIFDCFVAGCIPVYSGAPDIADAVPSEAFISATDFRSYGALDRHLRGMTAAVAEGHLEAARAFMASPAADRFSQARFVETLGSVLLETLGARRH
jgi:hypothetical protein